MTKEEAKAKLRKAESDLKRAEIILEMHENGVRELREDIEKLEEIINKPDRWQDVLVQPDKEEYFYLMSFSDKNIVEKRCSGSNRKPEHAFRTKEQAELIKEKVLLLQEMHAFAHVKNEGWMPDWRDASQKKRGLSYNGAGQLLVFCSEHCNDYIFGIVVKSVKIAEEMLEIFGERIEKFYNKMY